MKHKPTKIKNLWGKFYRQTDRKIAKQRKSEGGPLKNKWTKVYKNVDKTNKGRYTQFNKTVGRQRKKLED